VIGPQLGNQTRIFGWEELLPYDTAARGRAKPGQLA